MTAEIVNLRQARKRKARAGKSRQADENRRRHGRTPAERENEAAERERAGRLLDQHRQDDPAADK